MSKVFVDRELLEQIVNTNMGDYALIALQHKELLAILAQPAAAEGVGKWSELKKLAEKATPGPWWVDSHGHRVSTEDGMQTVFIAADKMGPATRHPETGNLSHWPNDWDASYIVNASPDKILELIAALSAVTAERDSLRELAYVGEHMHDDYSWKARHAELRAELDELRKDAERYRWLRDQAPKARGEWEIDGQRYGMMLGADQDDVDQAVDALMSAMAAKEA